LEAQLFCLAATKSKMVSLCPSVTKQQVKKTADDEEVLPLMKQKGQEVSTENHLWL